MKLSNLANVLRGAGLTVVESPGWADRGYAGQDLQAVRGVLWHHTATHRSRFTADAPTLSMCLNGRPDLPGPLCQIVFGRNGTVYLLAAGVANHAGAGSAPGVPKDMGNHYLIGIEMESSGIAPWDWTADQIRIAPHLGAALERGFLMHLPEAERYQGAHYEYSSQGKIDPAGWPGGMDGLRSSINAVLSGSAAIAPRGDTAPQASEEDDMFTDEDRALLRATLNKADGGQLRADLGYQNETLLSKVDGAYMNNVRDAQFAAIMESLGKTLNKDDGGYIVQLVQAIKPGTTDAKAVADALAGIIPEDIAKEVADELAARLSK